MLINLSLIALWIIVLYSPSLYGQFISDDIPVMQRLLSHPSSLSFRDLLYTGILQTFGNSTVAFHLLNLFFHLGATFFVYKIARRFSGAWPGFLIALLFGVHPVLTESVSWISGGTYAQYSFFTLASFYFFLLAKNRVYYILSVISFLLALFSSEKAIIFPAILFVYSFARKEIKRDWLKLSPYFILAGIWTVIYLGLFQKRLDQYAALYGNSTAFQSPVIQWIVALAKYILLAIGVAPLSFSHTYFQTDSLSLLVDSVICIVFGIILWLLYRHYRVSWFFGIFFLLALLPTMISARVSWVVAERYAYLSIAALCIGIGPLLKPVFQTRYKWPTVIGLVALILLFSYRTYQRAFDWQTNKSIWTKTLMDDPKNVNAYVELGNVYKQEKNYAKALSLYKKSFETGIPSLTAYFNIGDVYLQTHQEKKAIPYFLKVKQLNPHQWQADQALGVAYSHIGDLPNAIHYTNNALIAQPYNIQLYINLANLLIEAHQLSDAQRVIAQAYALKPQDKNVLEIKQSIEKLMK